MEALKLNYKKYFSPKLAKKILFILTFIIFFDFFFFPFPILAKSFVEADYIADKGDIIEAVYEENRVFLPENKDLEVKIVKNTTLTAYNSEEAQCDSTPCITANGFNVCEHGIEDTIAANFLPFGAKVKIPELFGDKIFIVRDRMNMRYQNRVDIWMVDKQDAINFGVKYAKVYILE